MICMCKLWVSWSMCFFFTFVSICFVYMFCCAVCVNIYNKLDVNLYFYGFYFYILLIFNSWYMFLLLRKLCEKCSWSRPSIQPSFCRFSFLFAYDLTTLILISVVCSVKLLYHFSLILPQQLSKSSFLFAAPHTIYKWNAEAFSCTKPFVSV